MENAKEIAERIKASSEWIPEDCEALCNAADMSAEWKAADGDNFEAVVYAAADKLGVEI